MEYLAAVMAKDPNFTATLFTEFSKQCTLVPPSYQQITNQLFDDRQDPLEYVKCVIGAITDAVSETNYEQLWKYYVKQLEKKFENIANCKNQGSPIDAAK